MGRHGDLPRARARPRGRRDRAHARPRARPPSRGRDRRRLPDLPRRPGLPQPARLPGDRPRHRGARRRAADLRQRLRGLGEQQPAVPGAQREVRHHPEAQRAGELAAVAARRRRRRARQRHRQPARAPAGRDHRPRADLLPAARRARDVRARHRAAAGAAARALPPRRDPDRRGRALLRQRQPGARRRRRAADLALPRDRGLPPRDRARGPRRLHGPDPADRADDRRGRRPRRCC